METGDHEAMLLVPCITPPYDGMVRVCLVRVCNGMMAEIKQHQYARHTWRLACRILGWVCVYAVLSLQYGKE